MVVSGCGRDPAGTADSDRDAGGPVHRYRVRPSAGHGPRCASPGRYGTSSPAAGAGYPQGRRPRAPARPPRRRLSPAPGTPARDARQRPSTASTSAIRSVSTTAAPPPRATRGACSNARVEARQPGRGPPEPGRRGRGRPARKHRQPPGPGLGQAPGVCGCDGQEVAECGDITGTLRLSGAAQQCGGLPDPVLRSRPVRGGRRVG